MNISRGERVVRSLMPAFWVAHVVAPVFPVLILLGLIGRFAGDYAHALDVSRSLEILPPEYGVAFVHEFWRGGVAILLSLVGLPFAVYYALAMYRERQGHGTWLVPKRLDYVNAAIVIAAPAMIMSLVAVGVAAGLRPVARRRGRPVAHK